MNIIIKRLNTGDIKEFTEMIRLFANVFEMEDFQMPGHAYLTTLLSRDDFIVYAAQYENTVVGGLTAYTLHSYYSQSSDVYLYDLAIGTSFQRKGIGKKLLLTLTEYCLQNGYKEFFVQADEADTHALGFYRSTGGSAEKVIHFTYGVKK
jgi:aminoglycoside 3-N-acetyltransferase I